MDHVEFYRKRFGTNWVLARRSPRILAKYGEDVVCITKKQMRQADLDYRAEHGDPYDKPRRLMYLALKQIEAHLLAGDVCTATMLALADAALKAERMR